MPLIASHPFKAIYVLLAVAFETLRFPLWIARYILPSLRPNPAWSFRQAIGVKIVRLFLTHAAAIEMNVPLPHTPGWEREQFTIIAPADSKHYTGPMTVGSKPPPRIGGTWYPHRPMAAELAGKDVVVHYHGGAFVIGDGRKQDAGFAAATIIKHARVPFVFAPQYRLAGGPTNEKFPGALQDALSSYLYVHLELGVPAANIIISGDSAGANLVLALLRYIEHFGKAASVPTPGAAWAWSPWCEPINSANEARTREAPNYPTDYIPSSFGSWGAAKYIPSALLDPKSKYAEYINHLGAPFKTASPLWITGGSSEVLFGDITQLYEEMKKEQGNQVYLDVQEHAPHDFILIGHIIGFELSAKRAAHSAGEWSRKVRKTVSNGKL